MALTRVDFQKTAGTNAGAAYSTASMTWLTNDLFIVIQGAELGGQTTNNPKIPTFAGGTFTQAVAAIGDDSSHCYAKAWQCAATSGGSGAISCASTSPAT